MNDKKLSSDEVPQMFTNWLLSMGCPPDKVPSLEKITQMCRGQYYMVWRSLMEHSYPRDVIRNKRLQVFLADIEKYKNKKQIYTEKDSYTTMPRELSLWYENKEVKEKVIEIEQAVNEKKEKLSQLISKISSKLSQRNLARSKLQEQQRKLWLLQQVSEELIVKKTNFLETKDIAESMCKIDEDVNVQLKLDKCLELLRPSSTLSPQPAASSSMVSSHGDANDQEEQLSSLANCSGDKVWRNLSERRANLLTSLSGHDRNLSDEVKNESPKFVLANMSALFCQLGLEILKQRRHIEITREKLTEAISDLSKTISGDSCELLVRECERAHASSRVDSFRSSLQALNERTDIFQSPDNCTRMLDRQVPLAVISRDIEMKRDELKRLMNTLTVTERKMYNVKECLVAVFNSFHKEQNANDIARFRGIQIELPPESGSTLRRYYAEARTKRRNRLDISMEMETSQNSVLDNIDINNANFADEIKIYLKKIKLEKNRKLVLESGEKIWCFETLQYALRSLHGHWLEEDIATTLLCPSLCPSRNIQDLSKTVATRKEFERYLRNMENTGRKENPFIDISSHAKQEHETVDKIKKRLNDNVTCLQKTEKTLEIGLENLSIWELNGFRKHISTKRDSNGRSYKDCEIIFMDNLNLTV